MPPGPFMLRPLTRGKPGGARVSSFCTSDRTCNIIRIGIPPGDRSNLKET